MNNSLAGIRAVFFDAVGTLIVPQPPAASVYAEVLARHGIALPVEEIAGRFRAAFQREEQADEADGWATSEKRELRRWQSIVFAVCGDEADPVAKQICFHELFEHFSKPAAWHVADGAGEVLRRLAGTGLTLGIASNYDRRLHSVADGPPELEPIRLRVISSEVGWRKPGPHFFAALVLTAQCEPGKILHVGDDRPNDYDGAIAAGLQAVLLDPDGKETGVRRISRLTGLTEIVAAGD
jgi:putative hydrolase of the HAD superfamily